jgi:hypothetical protein
MLVIEGCFGVQVWGDALAFAYFGSSSHGIVFLATLRTMCHLSLGLWTFNIVCLFVCFVYFCLYIK